ncbi:MAG: four helix bundle protein [Thermaceae bacterium]|nr:four helix bundle protein [Thermaceae bacterium]
MESYSNRFGFENWEVYQLAIDLRADVYKLTEKFPRSEQFGLTNQFNRAAVSVALNIAEGRGRGTDKDFARFLHQARGSLLETVSGCQIAVRLGFLSSSTYEEISAKAGQINAKLNTLISALSDAWGHASCILRLAFSS